MELHKPLVIAPLGRTGLQLLRLAAILLLIGYHAALITPEGGTGLVDRILRRGAGAGWVGTDLFLAIAGFLTFDSWQRSSSRYGWLLRRAGRVLPAYWAFLLFYLHGLPRFIAACGGTPHRLANYGSFEQALQHQPYLYSLTTNLLFASGTWIGAALEPLMTIAIGAQLVLLAGLLWPLRRKVGFLIAVGALELVGVGLRFSWRHEATWRSYSFPLTRCDAFLFGLAAAWLLSHEPWRSRLVRNATRLTLTGFVAGFVAIASTRGLDVGAQRSVQLGYPLIGFCFAWLVAAVSQAGINETPGVHAFLSAPWLVRLSKLGAITFAVYLFKLPVIDMVKDAMLATDLKPTVAALIVAGAAMACIVGWMWFRAVEVPLSRLFVRLVTRRVGQ